MPPQALGQRGQIKGSKERKHAGMVGGHWDGRGRVPKVR